MDKYQVICGNIGTVYMGNDEAEALRIYDEYREQSSNGYGRAAYERVYLMEDGSIRDEFDGDFERPI